MKTQKLRRLVQSYGSVDTFADKLGVSGAAVRYWLRGEATPLTGTIIKILKLSKGRVSITFEDVVRETKRSPE